MRYLFLALFLLVSLVHLYGSFLNDKKIRKYTKSWILLCLLGYYATSVSQVNWFVVAALVFSFLGDVALIFDGWFAVGGVSFLLSHVCFIQAYVPNIAFSAIPWFVYPLLALAYGAAIFLVFRAIGKYLPKSLFYPMLAYLIANAAMNGFALMQLLSNPGLPTALIYIGAVFFFVSDCILFNVRFHKERHVWRNHFPVMLAYIIGEFLIVEGLILLA